MSTTSARPIDPAELEMAGYLARIATGPELSKDLARDQAARAMELILADRVHAAQAAVFLVALRMKRESHDELAGVLDALRAASVREVADVDELVDMAEPYNGYLRHLPAAPFVPALLAACGVPCVVHGCREAGPKWGVTAHRVLERAGVPVDMDPAEAARRVAACGWAYVDLSRVSPRLAELARLRTLIVKRPCLSLLEKMIAPIRAKERTHLWIGYAHREYPEILARLARDFGYASMLAVRGVEGGALSSLSGRVRASRVAGDSALEDIEIAATEVVRGVAVRAPELPGAVHDSGHGESDAMALPPVEQMDAWAEAAARAGREALEGTPGPTADMMVLGAAAMLRHLGRAASLAEGAARAREALQSGEARRRFEAFAQRA